MKASGQCQLCDAASDSIQSVVSIGGFQLEASWQVELETQTEQQRALPIAEIDQNRAVVRLVAPDSV